MERGDTQRHMMDAQRVLVAIKGTELDDDAVRLSCNLVRERHGVVHVLYVIEVQRSQPLDAEEPEEAQRGEQILQATEEVARELGCRVEADVRQARNAGPAVVQEAVDREVDLILVTMPYKRRFGDFNLGSAIPFILKNAPCGVLVWRAPVLERVKGGLAR